MLSHVVNIILVFFTLGLILLFVVAHFTRFKTNLIVIIQQKKLYTHTHYRSTFHRHKKAKLVHKTKQ